MAGSAAEERIRAKAEAALRRLYPDARIIHELVLYQGAERIDLAAVTTNRLVLVEVKSERDTLDRLAAQMTRAMPLTPEVWLCFAAKHLVDIELRLEREIGETRRVAHPKGGTMYERDPNPLYLPNLCRARLLVETEDGFDFENRRLGGRYWSVGDRLEPWALLDMLWADELRLLTSTRFSREPAMQHAREHLTGRQIRRGVCALLRRRAFPRADPPDAPSADGLLKLLAPAASL